jgi:beta-glucanase (GH16 family)
MIRDVLSQVEGNDVVASRRRRRLPLVRTLGAVAAAAVLVTGCAAAQTSTGSGSRSSAGSSWAATPSVASAAGPLASSRLKAESVAAVPGKWKPVMTDNFSGTKLNTNLWQPGWFGTGITPSVNTNDRACNKSSQVKVSGGQLHITAKRARIVCDGVTHHYETGMLSSNPGALGAGKGFQFTHGLIEFRAKIPGDGKGHCANWSALWFSGQIWPVDGEADVFECLDGHTTWNLHTGPHPGRRSVANHTVKGKWTGWHTFAMDWTAHTATEYFDGKKLGTNRYVVNHPNFIVISNEIRVGAKVILPSTLDVDWVKVYKASSAKGAKRIILKA